jgi:uncharacterized cupredoxin-like copper-binding protein
MNKRLLVALAAGGAWMVASTTLQAADTLPAPSSTDETPTTLTLNLGNDENAFVAAPKRLNMEAGKPYRLVIKNPSLTPHSFWAPLFDEAVNSKGRIEVDRGEVKLRTTGQPGEELYTWEIKIEPGGTAIWELVPAVAGLYSWGCTNQVHAAVGVVGEIDVRPERTAG